MTLLYSGISDHLMLCFCSSSPHLLSAFVLICDLCTTLFVGIRAWDFPCDTLFVIYAQRKEGDCLGFGDRSVCNRYNFHMICSIKENKV